jgi:homoserine/homoserine lactone efflux protein
MEVGFLLAACFVASLSPGPASLATLSTALRSGARRASWHTLGLATGEVPISIAALHASSWLTHSHPEVMRGLAWVGAAWFAYTGLLQLLYPRDSLNEEDDRVDGRLALFTRGFLVNLTNPKTLPWMLVIIQSAHVPVDAISGRTVAIFLFCTVGAEAVVMTFYAFLAGSLRPRLADPSVSRNLDRVTGVIWLMLSGVAVNAALH